MSTASSKDRDIELRTKAIGFDLFSNVEEEHYSFLESQWWENQILEWCMQNEDMKAQLLRFVDVFPSLRTPRQVVNHLRQYFPPSNRAFPAFLRLGLDLSGPTALTRAVLSHEARAIMVRMAHRFIAGATIAEAFDVLKDIRADGMTFTLDLLGEAVVSESEAGRYLGAYVDTLRHLSARWDEFGAVDSPDTPNVSLKLSSLYSRFDPIDDAGTKAAVKRRLRELLRVAREVGAFVFVDMEQYAHCRITIEIFRELLEEDEFCSFSDVGIAIQAYLRESEAMVRELLEWVQRRGTPVTVRLVKGAYWDYEIVHARQMGWPAPVFASKAETDACFERITKLLLDHFPAVRTAIGSHNIRSIAYAMAVARARGIAPSNVEFQMLYGMGDPIKKAILRTDYPLRVYTPFGELIPGMAYLVRRILENTSNESFLRQDFFLGASPEELLRDPVEIMGKNGGEPTTPPVASVSHGGFRNEPETDFSQAEARGLMRRALADVRETFGRLHPMVIGGNRVENGDPMISINPSRKAEIIGKVSQAGPEHADRALAAAHAALASWGQRPAEERAEALSRAAALMNKWRFELAALEVYEVGKAWREADADVTEAIDYLRYYGSEMIRLSADPFTERLPGERNEYVYRPRGVGVVIAPWNFPLAILTGMSSAAIAAGNTIIMKPAPQSPIIAARLMHIYEEAGIPPGVVNLLPGLGETVGEHLVKSPEVDFIVFTGSREVGERINMLAAAHPSRSGIKRVIAEMGGKNAIIVDESADLDEAVIGTLASAFGYQGQKCSAASRLIVIDTIYDALLPRLVEAARSLKVGPADDPSCQMGPLIDEEAYRKVLSYIELGKQKARVALETDVSHLKDGFFVGPTIFVDVASGDALAQEEIFGPLLTVLKCANFGEAIEIANNTAYALTGGVYSRTPEHIERTRRKFMVGNLYVNRKITGAIVRRQPFGGFKMSGIGSKAGGPDYLRQFVLPQTVTENIMRHGFAPLED